MAQAQQLAGAATKIMYMALALIGSETPLGQALAKAAQQIGKMAGPGTGTGDKNALDALRIQQQKMAPAEQAVKQGGLQQIAGAQPQPPAAMAA